MVSSRGGLFLSIFVIIIVVIGVIVIGFMWGSLRDTDSGSRSDMPSVFIEDRIIQTPDGVVVSLIGSYNDKFSVIVRVSGCMNKSYLVSFSGTGERSIKISIPQVKIIRGCSLMIKVFYGNRLLASRSLRVGIGS